MAIPGDDLGPPPPIYNQGDGNLTISVPGGPPVPTGIIGIPIMGPGTRSPQQRVSYAAKIDIGGKFNHVTVPLDSGDSVIVTLESVEVGKAGTAFPGVSSGTVPVLVHKISTNGYVFQTISGSTNMSTETTSLPMSVSGYSQYRLEVSTPADSTCACAVTVQVKSNT